MSNGIEYFLEPLVFQVENTLFRIPREYLSQESPVFLDMLHLPQPVASSDGKSGDEGSGDTSPIVLPETININSFRTLLRVLYPRDPLGEPTLSKEEWLLVLELSKMWDMRGVKNIASNHLVPDLEDDPAYKRCLAKIYEIQDWKQPALERLIRRDKPLGEREYQLLDQETILAIAALRESCYSVFRDTVFGKHRHEDTSITHWEIQKERGRINVDLSTVEFTCPNPPQQPQSLEESCGQYENDNGQRNGQFFFEKVVFKVANEFYKVPNQPFARHSLTFRRIFSNRGFRKYDCQDPLVIDASITKADFEALLTFFFPEPVANPELTIDDWASILKLAVRWEMPQVKQLAIQKLEDPDFGSAVVRLRMAQESGIQKWFLPEMQMLVTRREPLGVAEYQVLNQERLLQVLDLRERAHSRYRYDHGGIHNHLRTSRGEVPLSLDLSDRLATFV